MTTARARSGEPRDAGAAAGDRETDHREEHAGEADDSAAQEDPPRDGGRDERRPDRENLAARQRGERRRDRIRRRSLDAQSVLGEADVERHLLVARQSQLRAAVGEEGLRGPAEPEESVAGVVEERAFALARAGGCDLGLEEAERLGVAPREVGPLGARGA